MAQIVAHEQASTHSNSPLLNAGFLIFFTFTLSSLNQLFLSHPLSLRNPKLILSPNRFSLIQNPKPILYSHHPPLSTPVVARRHHFLLFSLLIRRHLLPRLKYLYNLQKVGCQSSEDKCRAIAK